MTATSALAWGNEGHEAIGLIADHYLEPGVRAKVREMLAPESYPALPSTISARATWADKYRETGRGKPPPNAYTQTRQWHFIDFDVDKSPSFKDACFGDGPAPTPASSKEDPNDCVVRKIEQFSKELRESHDQDERILALMYLLHFVGDVHQPLHTAQGMNDDGKPDAGGNTVFVIYGRRTTGDNLHSYWDSNTVNSIGTKPELVAQRLIPQITKDDIAAWTKAVPGKSAPREWALESFSSAKSVAYAIPKETEPCKVRARDGTVTDQRCHRLDADYAALASEEAAYKLKQAGVRLATLLNELLR